MDNKKPYLLFIPGKRPLTAHFRTAIGHYVGLPLFDIVIDNSPTIAQVYENFLAEAQQYEAAVMHHSDWILAPAGLLYLAEAVKKDATIAAAGCHPYYFNEKGSLVPMTWEICEPALVIQLYAINPKNYLKPPADFRPDISAMDTVLKEQLFAKQNGFKIAFIPVGSWPYPIIESYRVKGWHE